VPTPDTIIFAVQAALKLGQAARQAYVDSTRNRGLALPNPEMFSEVTAKAAAKFFIVHAGDYRPPGLSEILAKIGERTDSTVTKRERRQLVDFYIEYRLADPDTQAEMSASIDGSFFTESALSSMLEIRQWERGAEGVKPLQRVAGTIVEILVDYYATTPGAFNEKAPHGKSIRVLLTTLDKIEFSTVPIHDLPEKLVVATIESIAKHPDFLTGDKDTQELIQVTATALGKDVKARIETFRTNRPNGNLDVEQRIVDWGELVFRSVLSSGGKLVAEDPKRFLGIKDDGTDALVNHVGVAALDFVLSQPVGSIDKAFGREGLDVIVRASLRAVGEHPEILTETDNLGLKKMLSEVATTLGQFDALVAPGTLPEVARVVLEKGGQNLPLIWPDKNDPKRHLLISAASKTLAVLTEKPAGGKWTPTFGKPQLIEVMEFTLDEFVQNPGWLINATGERSGTLEVAVSAVVDVLKKKADNRLSPETGIAVLRASLNAVAGRKKLLEELPGGQLAVSAVIDTVISKIFDETLDDAVTWAMVRHEVITKTVESALDAFAISAAGEAEIAALATTLDAQIVSLAGGGALDVQALQQATTSAIGNAGA